MTLTLRPYQAEAVERIVERRAMLLALVMGAGKTATAIAAVRNLRRVRAVDHGLVFAPKSVTYQWAKEIHTWDPRAKVQIVEGTKAQRLRGITRSSEYHYTILGYGAFNWDWEDLKDHAPTDFVILDEATAIKSFTTQRSRRAKSLGKHAPVRMALSGQPVENRPEEAFSIMEFVDAEVLGSFHKFDRTFIKRDHWGKAKSYHNLPIFHDRIAPAMVRKSREDIKEWLPELVEIEYPVVLDPFCMRLHTIIRDDLSEAIDLALAGGATGGTFDVLAHYGRVDKGAQMQLMGNVMSRLLAMRMLSSHPGLLRLSADNFDSELTKTGSEYASTLQAAGLLDKVPTTHAKLTALLDQITEVIDEDPDHKVVVFSYFKPMLSMIGTELAKHKIPFVKITGDTSARDRGIAIDRFNTDPRIRVFLSSDAGAYGVDLNQGSHLINYDLPWSAGALGQRIARIDRTSSPWPTIQVTHLYGERTIEARMLAMLQQKRKVSKAFIDGEFDQRSGGISLDLQSLREFLDQP